MNVERLHVIVRAVWEDLAETNALETVRQIQSALDRQVKAPQDASHQQNLSAALQKLEADLSGSEVDGFPASWQQVLEELGFDDALGSKLATRVRTIFAQNQITPSIAASEIRQVADDLQRIEQHLSALVEAFDFFGIGSEELDVHRAEVAILIPREAVDEQVDKLGRELVEFREIIGPFLEVATGTRPPLIVSSISSSDFGVFLDLTPTAAAARAVALDRILSTYKQLLEIRTLRAGLSGAGLPDEALTAVDEHANGRMQDENRAIAEDILAMADDLDPGRANELRVELQNALNSLANRVDKGYNVDVRASEEVEDEPEDAEDQDAGVRNAIDQIRRLSPRLKFVNATGRPILYLPEGNHDGNAAAGIEDAGGQDGVQDSQNPTKANN